MLRPQNMLYETWIGKDLSFECSNGFESTVALVGLRKWMKYSVVIRLFAEQKEVTDSGISNDMREPGEMRHPASKC